MGIPKREDLHAERLRSTSVIKKNKEEDKGRQPPPDETYSSRGLPEPYTTSDRSGIVGSISILGCRACRRR